MKKSLVSIALAGAMFCSSGALFAQDYHHDWGHDDHRHDDHRNDHRDDHRYDHHDDHRGRGFYDRGRHEGWYRRGGRVPPEYRGGGYVVNDWRHDRLRQPPRGYHWVRSDNGDFLLVAVTTGIIASILAHQ